MSVVKRFARRNSLNIRRHAACALAALAVIALAPAARASEFPPVVPLASLDGATGFKFDGISPGDGSGHAVASAGDVNGDGIADLIVGSPFADPAGRNGAGTAYVLFGKASGIFTGVDISTLNGGNGFRVHGANRGSEIGHSVASAGDVNGDGFDDLIVGAHPDGTTSNAGISDAVAGLTAEPRLADSAGIDDAGSSYVVFGRASGFAPNLDVSALDGRDGFRIDGVARGDGSGVSIAGVGDVNGDAVGDLMIAARWANPAGRRHAGSTYIVFGSAAGFPAIVNLNVLNGSNGFRLDGAAADDKSGGSVAGAGDVNGDGFADVIIGAHSADPDGNTNAGSSYVMFGKASGFPASISLAALDGRNGFRLDGAKPGDGSGVSVNGAGDVNGDGLADLIIGAAWADPDGRSQAGSSYVVFGRRSGFAAAINLAALDGRNGFRLDGAAAEDWSGFRAAGAGDVNGDGFADVIVGVPNADPDGRNGAGSSYVVFGRASGYGAATDLSALGRSSGFRLDGAAPGDESGGAVAGAGDVNGDGAADLIIGARWADRGGGSEAGSGYVVFGRLNRPVAQAELASRRGWTISPAFSSVKEDGGPAIFTVSRRNTAAAETVYISTTQTKSYANNGDYVGIASRPLHFSSGESSKRVDVTLIDDSVAEPSETFGLAVRQNSQSQANVVLARSAFTILNDDSRRSYALSVTVSGDGLVTSSSGGISCPKLCTAEFAANEIVLLTATAASGWSFTGWGGACSGTGRCSVNMAQARSVMVAFKASSVPSLEIVSPYLMPSFTTSPANLHVAAFLANRAARTGAQAKGIVADGTSEAVVIYEAAGNSPVFLSAAGGILTPYSDYVLGAAPDPGADDDSLEIPPEAFIVADGKTYAVALLRPRKVQTLPLEVKASQAGAPVKTVPLPVIQPPLILVHGLWGDRVSLQALHEHLAVSQQPANDNIYPFQYARDLPFDDDRIGSNLIATIESAINKLDSRHIVGGRVDVVAHGMGGLVVRHLSSRESYRSWHDRRLGRFRLIITLDTPQNGSLLAKYLVEHADDRNPSPGRTGRRFWYLMCQSLDPLTTVQGCFRDAGQPFGTDGDDLAAGAVHSLDPNSSSMKRLRAIDPNVKNAKWLAIGAQAGPTNQLVFFLNRFIAETGNRDTISSIFEGKPNDALVAAESQAAGARPEQIAALRGLAHFNLPYYPFKDDVLDSLDVHAIVGCWLDSGGGNFCRDAAASSTARLSSALAVPALPKLLSRRLLLDPPKKAEIAVPLELAISSESRNLKHLVVEQRDEMGHRVGPQMVDLVKSGGGVRARFTPQLLGDVSYRLWAYYNDDSVSIAKINVQVSAPVAQPSEFRGDSQFNEVLLGHIGASYRLHPAARYSTEKPLNPNATALYPSATKLYPNGGLAIPLDGHVRFRLLDDRDAAVIDLAADGTVVARRAGKVKVEAAFGSAADVITVIVRPGRR